MTASLKSGKTLFAKNCLAYDFKHSDGDAPVIQEL